MQTFKTILNDVWDKVNHQLQGASWAGSGIASYLFATDTDILNDVWDPVNHNLRIVGSGGGSGTVTASGPPVAGQAAEWTTATNITGVAVTGTGSYVKGTNPVLVTPALGTPTALVLTNATLLPDGALSANVPLLNASNVFSIGQRVLSLGIGVAAPALTGQIDATTVASTGTVPPMFRLTGAAHTALTASVARPSISLDFSASQQWATGAGPTIQAIIDILQPGAITAVGASTFPSATTLYIRGAPPKGANVTLTKTSAVQIDGGPVSTAGVGYALEVNAPTGATTNRAALFAGGQTLFPDGTIAAPSISFSSASQDSGLSYSSGTGTSSYTAQGLRVMQWNTTNVVVDGNIPLGFATSGTADAYLRRFAAANLQLGLSGASATPVAQTLSVQDGVGADIAGVNWTLRANRATGAGTPGRILLSASVAALGTGSTLQTAVTHLDVGGGLVRILNAALPSTGAAPTVGNATLVGGTVTISTTAAVTSSVIILSRKTDGGTIGLDVVYTINSGVSFTITSSNVLDTSTFSWAIIQTF